MENNTFWKKKDYSCDGKLFGPKFSRIIECDIRQGTIYKSSQGVPTTTVLVIKSFLWDLGSCWKHKFLKRNATFPVELEIWTFFSRVIEYDERQAKTCKCWQSILISIVQAIWPFLWDPRNWEPNLFQNKAIVSEEKDFRRLFLIMPSTADDENLFVGLDKVFWEIRC